MTDRELLELAAKAAGLRWSIGDLVWYNDMEGTYIKNWSPPTDDGDALRLAVQLNILNRAAHGYEWPVFDLFESHADDPFAATRRAIVRVAAEIGKAMK